MAQAEIEKKEKRQQEGIAAKKARGEWSDYGRPKAQKPDNWDEVIARWQNGEITAVKAMELTGTKKNLELRVDAEAGACAGKKELATLAKKLNLDAIHDTVHEMAKDEARHGAAFAGLLKRYFG